MTLPLEPPPRLSAAARPIVLPPDPPDLAMAERQAGNAGQGDRDLLERELLGHAMGSEAGLAQLRRLDPQEFAYPVNRNVARAIVDLADQGRPHDAAAVTDELRRRPLFATAVEHPTTQLPAHLDPEAMGRHLDPDTVGLGAWERTRLATPTRAPLAAQEIRAHTRQDRALAAARAAVHRYAGALEQGRTGRVVADHVGEATLDLAEQMVSIPKALDVERAALSRDLAMPRPPALSVTGRKALAR